MMGEKADLTKAFFICSAAELRLFLIISEVIGSVLIFLFFFNSLD